jgi:hypothetical protein
MSPEYNPKFCYDQANSHIYRINLSNYAYSLHVSEDNGNPYTWQMQFYSENPIYLSVNKSHSGEIYLADWRRIYKSTDFGLSFAPFAELPHRIVGIYKKPSSDILYAATRFNIFEVNPDSTIRIKELPVPESFYQWFPLNYGDKWVYNFAGFNEYGQLTDEYTTYREIAADNIIINNKNYFLMLYKSPCCTDSLYYRIDSLDGRIYTIQSGVEGLFYDFQSEVGDTIIFEPSDPYSSSYYIYDEEDISIFGYQTKFRTLVPNWFEPIVVLVDSIGLYHSEFFEFGGFSETLKGFIRNGVVYGDTTLTAVDYTIKPLNAFDLYQNYPNPFNPITNIQYCIGSPGLVRLKIYDILGKEVAILVNEEKPAGRYSIEFNGSSLASGVYFYKLETGEFIQVKKMLLLK